MCFNKIFITFFFITSLLLGQKFDLKSYVKFGYDSNPMKLSENEINESLNDIFLDKYNINSQYFKLSLKLKTSKKIFKRKTKLEFEFKRNIYKNLDQKTNFGVSFKLDQPLGSYQHIKFYYSYVPDIFLREFNDEAFSNYYYEVEEPLDVESLNAFECYFNLGKVRIVYESPYLINKSKISIGYTYETQFYNKYFTEFDLRINGIQVSYLANKSAINSSYNISYFYNYAANITLNDDNPHRSFMNRGYTENGLKLSYEFKVPKFKVGMSFKGIYRQYRSHIEQDKLHYNREHSDIVFSIWGGFKIDKLNQKINLSHRTRNTSSPENWVEDLKTFNRIDLSYTIYFNKISFRNKK